MVNEADIKRLRELVPGLMLLADYLDASKGVLGDEGQEDLRWLSAKLPKLMEEREQYMASTYCAYCSTEFLIDNDAELVGQHIATCEQHPMREVEQQLAQAREEVGRLRSVLEYVWDFTELGTEKFVAKHGYGRSGAEKSRMIQQALSPSEAEDAKD